VVASPSHLPSSNWKVQEVQSIQRSETIFRFPKKDRWCRMIVFENSGYNQTIKMFSYNACTWITLYMHPLEPPEKEARTVGKGFTFSSWNTSIPRYFGEKLPSGKAIKQNEDFMNSGLPFPNNLNNLPAISEVYQRKHASSSVLSQR
jgi:hypothetical protein